MPSINPIETNYKVEYVLPMSFTEDELERLVRIFYFFLEHTTGVSEGVHCLNDRFFAARDEIREHKRKLAAGVPV